MRPQKACHIWSISLKMTTILIAYMKSGMENGKEEELKSLLSMQQFALRILAYTLRCHFLYRLSKFLRTDGVEPIGKLWDYL
jgi:hypothetical protein